MGPVITLSFLDRIDAFLDKIASPIYYWLIGLFYLFYLAAFFGFFYVQPAYIHVLSAVIQIFISIVLLIRFNPFRKHAVYESNNILVFACAFFLLINVCLTESIVRRLQTTFVNDVHSDIRNIERVM